MTLKTISHYFSGPGALLALIFFFLPWVSISCSDLELADASGYDLASKGISSEEVAQNMANMTTEMMTGMEGFPTEGLDSSGGEFSFSTEPTTPTDADLNQEADFTKADARLYAVPLMALIALSAAGAGLYEKRTLNLYTAVGALIIPAIIGLALMGVKFMQIESDMKDANGDLESQMGMSVIETNYEIGWWLTGIGFLAMFAGGVLVFLDTGQAAPSITPADRAKFEQVEKLLAEKRTSEAQAILREMDHPLAQQLLTRISGEDQRQFAPQTSPVESVEDQLKRAKELLVQKRYSEARILLYAIEHPTAKKWLAKLDEVEKR